MRRIVCVLCSLLVCLLFIPASSAQSMFATLSGTVMDASGAVVPGANVTAKEIQTGELRKTVTTQSGFFSFTTLPVSAGGYELIVEAKGFAKYDVTGIMLSGADIRTVNVTLKVATTAETVKVEALQEDVSVVESGEKSATVDARTIQDLSLVSRDATELVKLLPGSILSPNGGVNKLNTSGELVGLNVGSPLSNSNINGQWVDISMDGAHTFDPGSVGGNSPVTPNQDMISEVKVLTSNFSADNPKGPVVVNTVSKSGTKNFHGDGRFYARNTNLNATDAYNVYHQIAKPNDYYYYPGFGIGGPVIIPGTGLNKSRQKMFFYDGFEYYKQEVDNGVFAAAIPTAAMLNGDFSALNTPAYSGEEWNAGWAQLGVPHTPICNGGNACTALNPLDNPVDATRLQNCVITNGVMQPGPGGTLSPCIDPNMQALLKSYFAHVQPTNTDPSAAANSGFNYLSDSVAPMNGLQNLARVDFNVSDNTKVFVSYNYEKQTASWVNGLWNGGGLGNNAIPEPSPIVGGDYSHSVTGSLVHVFSPTMTTETQFHFTYITFPETVTDPNSIFRAGYGPSGTTGVPGFSYKGVYSPNVAPVITGWGYPVPNMGPMGDGFHPDMVCFSKIPAVSQSLTKVMGTHTLKFGFYFEQVYHTQDNWGQFMGIDQLSSWGNTVTGNGYADVLTGILNGGYNEQAQPPNPIPVNERQADFYAQDDWKVSRHLTINAGIRFDHMGEPFSPTYGMAVFYPGFYDPTQPVYADTGLLFHSIAPFVPDSGSKSRFLYYSPRLGASFDVFGNGRTVVRGGWGKYRNDISVQANSFVQPAQTASGSVSFGACGYQNNVTNGNIPCTTMADVDNYATTLHYGGKLGGPSQGLSPISISVSDPNQDEEPLLTTFSVSVDQKLPGKLNAEISYVGNRGNYGQSATTNLVNIVNPIQAGALWGTPTSSNATVKTACSSTGSNGDTYDNMGGLACQELFRPYPNYTQINEPVPAGKSQFDALEASLNRNVGFMTLMLNYTWSKAFSTNDLSGIFKDYGASEFYGVSPLNRAQVLSAAYVFRVPGLHGGNSILRGATNGWEISGVTQVESGANMTVQSNNLNYSRANSGTADDVTLNPNPPYGNYGAAYVMGTPDVNLYPSFTCNPTKSNPKGTYLNPNCFAPAAQGTFGQGGMPYLPGPYFWNSDLSVLKNFKVTERQSLQFRFAAFNFMNHSLPSFASGDSALKAQFNTAGALPSSFGAVVAGNVYGHRIVELGLKYMF